MRRSACAAEENKKNGWDMRIHVDGASGAMVAPFVFPGAPLARRAVYSLVSTCAALT